MSGFILILASTIIIAVGTLFPGSGPMPFFAGAWWFKVLGAAMMLANLGALVIAVVQLKRAALVGHLGVAILFAGIIADTRSTTIRAELTQGETDSTFTMNGAERPLGFALTLFDFHWNTYVARIRVNHGDVRTSAPSHPLIHKGWIILPEDYYMASYASRFILAAESGETLSVADGERFRVPGTDLEMEFDGGYAGERDTLFHFHLYEGGAEKVTGFMSGATILPPSIRLPLELLHYGLSCRYVSILQIVKHPGAWIVFVAFGVILIGLIVLAVERPRVRERSRSKP